MRGSRTASRTRTWIEVALAVWLGATAAGCRSAPARKTASIEPGLNDSGATVVEAAPPAGSTLTWVDRHPLFAKPREYYENSGNNTIVKTAAATVIGIPAGIFGEIRQIVVGAPGQTRY
jgi:hypothetical protein